MPLIYDIGISLYGGALRLASLWHAKARKMVQGRREAENELRELHGEGCDLWIHAASLGEMEQAMPVLERVLEENPKARVVVSFYSPSGYEVCQRRHLKARLVYLPLDTRRKMKRFLALMQPAKAVIVKYEFWPNMLAALRKAEIPTYLISAIFRPSQAFFKPWGGMWRKMLSTYSRIFVQDKASLELLEGLGMKNVEIAGDTRFDRVARIRDSARIIPEIEAFKGSHDQMIVFGSSWPQDEALYLPWLEEHPGVKAVVAPHEWDEARLNSLLSLPGAVAYSQRPTLEQLANANILVLDTFGLLSSVYRYASAAYIGGGFGAGIHNINEAAIYGIPVAFGPRHHKFKEASDLLSQGGALEVKDKDSMALALNVFTSDASRTASMGKAAAAYEEASIGATDKIYRKIFS